MNTIAVVLAGGEGRRLHPLTSNRMKALVPFCNACALVDFALSNILHSDIRECVVVVQDAQFQPMRDHLEAFSKNCARSDLRLSCVCPTLLQDGAPFSGTADALLRTLHHIFTGRSRHGALAYVCGADHVYLFDVRNAIRFHVERHATATVIGGHVGIADATRYGVLVVDRDRRVMHIEEKPRVPTGDPLDPRSAVVSMGDYIFEVEGLLGLVPGAADTDIASHLIPALLETGDCRFFDFEELNWIGDGGGGPVGYWRDIGTIEAYWQASMDALSTEPGILDGMQGEWPLHSGLVDAGDKRNRHEWLDSAVSTGARIDGGPRFTRCVVMAGAHVLDDVSLEDAIVTQTAVVKPGTRPSDLGESSSPAGRVRVFHD